MNIERKCSNYGCNHISTAPCLSHCTVCAGLCLFLAQFIRLKKPYQLMMAIAMPASLLIYIQPESRTLFYTIGLLVALDLLLALVISLIQRFRHPQEKKSNQQQEAAAK